MTGPDDHRTDQLLPDQALEEASDWLLRVEDAPGDATLRAELEAWLEANPDNAKAWALANRSVLLTRKASAGEGRSTIPTPQSAATRFGRRKWRDRPVRRLAFAAMAAAVVAFIVAPNALILLRGGHVSGTAQTRALNLADGSAIILGADSAIVDRASADKREVVLVRGEVWFDVAHDKGRPFVVHADNMSVTVIGTAFDVVMTDRTMSVGLARGAVRVRRPGLAPIDIAMTPGQRVVIDRTSGAAAEMAVDVREIGAWRSGRLAVRNTKFADVVEALDRYYAGMILVRGERLQSTRVTGVYDLADPAGSLRTLASPVRAHVRQFTPWLTIVYED